MSTIIKDIQRNSREIIRIETSEFKGRELINIRIWYQAIDTGSGDVIYKPTQKGITLNVAEYEELRDGIVKLGVYLKDLNSGETPEQPEEIAVDNSDENKKETKEKEDNEDNKEDSDSEENNSEE